MFNKINHFLATGEKLKNPTLTEVKDICIEHTRRLVD